MSAHTENEIIINAPLSFVWARTNDVANWPSLFTEYASAEILEQEDNRVKFRLTMHPDENGTVWSWVSERETDKEAKTVTARRVETGPFEYMKIFWEYEAIADDQTRMRWVQDFQMKPTAPVDDAGMGNRINTNSKIQLGIIKDKLEAERQNVVACAQCAPNDRRGGDIRTVLAPSTVGTSSGFGGTVTVEPGEAVAEHYHPYSEEYLFVVGGELRVDLDGEARTVSEGEAVFVPRNVKHRLVNTGDAPVSAVFFLSPLAPRPEIGHVDTESKEEAAAIAAAAVGLVGSGTGA